MTVPYEATYSKKLGFGVSSKDAKSVTYGVTLSVERVKSMQDLLRANQLREHVKRRQLDVRRELGWASYVAALVTSSPKERATLVFVPLHRAESGDAVVYGPTTAQEVLAVDYPLIGWRLLFNAT
jgi:hypothetical protein